MILQDRGSSFWWC